MEGQERLIYGWDGAEWGKVLIDADGHLQVDVVAAVAPAGMATSALQTTGNTRLNTIITALAGGLPASLVSGSLSIINNTLSQQHIYGYDGADWQRLAVESAAQHNLRVKLYDGANGIDSELLSTVAIPDATRGLVVNAALRLSRRGANTWEEWSSADQLADGWSGRYLGTVGLWSFNGSNWNRLRSFGVGILKTGRAAIGLLDVRLAGTGQVGAPGARKLYWMTMNPTAAASVIELTDDTDGSTAIKWEMTHGVNSAHHMNLDPPLEFTNGIYLKTFDNMLSIIFGYL